MKIAGLDIKVDRTAYRAFLIVGFIPVVLRVAYAALFRRQELDRRALITVPLLGVGVVAYHALAQFVHQLGHALAARSTGYPMTGIRYEYAFNYSEYPPDEPLLPDSVHIRRSFGGVAGTALMAVIATLLWLRRKSAAHWFTRWLLASILLDSLLLFFASAVLSDGVLFLREESWKENKTKE